jgi:arginyl-tRNA synthetase
MMDTDEQQVIHAIQAALASLGFGERPVPLRQIPFNGSWGYATPVAMQLAHESVARREVEENGLLNKKEAKQREQALVQEEAQVLAERIASLLGGSDLFSRVEAVRGYVNAYFDAGTVANRLVRRILTEGEQYGAGPARASRVMIEYSQPNTHKAFHIGHLRHFVFGNALDRLLRFSG